MDATPKHRNSFNAFQIGKGSHHQVLLLIFIAAIVTLNPAGLWAKTSLIYPVDRMVVHESDVTLLGATDTPGEPVRLNVNGSGIIPVANDDGTFRAEVKLRPGRNIIKADTIRVYVSFEMKGGRPPKGFANRYLHPPVEEDCANCHPFTSPGDYATMDDGPALCLNCHDDPRVGGDGGNFSRIHSPLEEEDCSACHDPHVGATRYLNPLPAPDLCYQCHDSVTEGKGDIHGPVAAGDCTGCHSPHGSPYQGLLLARGDEVCMECHDDPRLDPRDRKKLLRNIHAAIDEGCAACHDPHASDQRFNLAMPQVELCGQCHDDIRPTGEGVTGHSPIADDGECTACHRPHASSQRKLLTSTVPNLCYECHDDVTVDGQDGGMVHSPVEDGACTDCHNPHGGFGSLLIADGGELCSECHDPFDKPEGGSVHDPVAGGDCLDCHRHHAGPFAKLLPEQGAALCYLCHDEFEGPRLHSPIADDSCTECHSPHVAQAPKLLPLPGVDMCLECHDDPTLLPKMQLAKSIHSPIADDHECTPCHSPHAGTGAMLSNPVPALCWDCHDDVTSGKGGEVLSSVHTPVEEGGCLDCHRPHSAGDFKLLEETGNSLCLSCHDDPALDQSGTHFPSEHPPVTEDCSNCHSPHASDNSYNLVEDTFTLCSGCHDSHQGHSLDASAALEDQNGIVKLPASFPVTFDERLVCTGCHMPHGGTYRPLLNVPKMDLCGQCHGM